MYSLSNSIGLIESAGYLLWFGLFCFSMFRLKKFHWEAARARSEIYSEPIRRIDRMMPPAPAHKSEVRPEDIRYRRYWRKAFWRTIIDVGLAWGLMYVIKKLVI